MSNPNGKTFRNYSKNSSILCSDYKCMYITEKISVHSFYYKITYLTTLTLTLTTLTSNFNLKCT